MSTSGKRTVELYYDVLSPYTWIAFEELCRYRKVWNIDLKFKPMLLGAIMQASGNRPPGVVPAKAVYSAEDLRRLRKYYQIPINEPANFADIMFNKGSLAAQRLLTVVHSRHPHLTESLSRELWMRIWSRDEDITTPESLTAASKKIGLSEQETENLLKLTKEDSMKNQLKKVTQEAIDYGAFGAPTIIVHDANNKKHMVFGSDRMHVIAMLLNEKYVGPLVEHAKL